MEDTQLKLLNEVAVKQNYIKYSVKEEKATKKGDNFIGNLYRLVLKATKSNGSEEILHLICKAAPTSENRRKLFLCDLTFKREIFIYENVLPSFTKLEIERSIPINRRFKYAKLYISNKIENEETIILEDLKFGGYVINNRLHCLDIMNCVSVIHTFAHYHAFSFALRDQKPNEFAKYENLNEIFFCRSFFAGSENRKVNAFKRAFLVLDPIKDKLSWMKLQQFEENFFEHVDDCALKDRIGEYGVISHGDSWINNILFKYQKNNESSAPISICLIDFQLSRYASPIQDIVYFLFTVTNKSFRDTHWDTLFNEYYVSLTKHITALGSNIDELYPKSVFQKHIKKFSKYGLITSILLLHVLLSNDNETVDPSELAENRTEFEMKMLEKTMNDTNYRDRLRGNIIDMVEREFI